MIIWYFFSVGLGVNISETPLLIESIVELSSPPSASLFFSRFASLRYGNNTRTGFPFLVRESFDPPDLSDLFLVSALGDDMIPQVETVLKENRKSKNVFNSMSWLDFLSRYRSEELYMVSSIPLVLRDLLVFPKFLSCGGRGWGMDTPLLWLAGRQTQSVVHRDAEDNYHCIVNGRKSFLLWSPESGVDEKEFGWGTGEGYGEFAQIDVDEVDLKKFPGWATLPAWQGHLMPGDCIFIPEGWFHYVESADSRTLSFHVWFRSLGVWVENETCDDKLVDFPISRCAFDDDPWTVETTLRDEMLKIPGRSSFCKI